MSTRQRKSGGQAIVMVTLALFAMAGMMGLAVDLGWSYFVQKQAQSAADGAALAATHRAYVLLGASTAGLTSCPGALECTGTAVRDCGSVDSSKNLSNGCLYAKANGFDWDVNTSKQTVAMQADVGAVTAPPTVANISNISYWVTVRTTQTIPQLFSAMLSNTQGTVSAIATAAVTAETFPGSFVGMNREGDCQTDSSGAAVNCGVDLDVSGAGNALCKNSDGSSSGVKASVCGPSGIYLASQCNGTSAISGCSDGGKNDNYAGQTQGSANVWGSTNQIKGVGAVNDPSKWTPAPTNGHSGPEYSDPHAGQGQPSVAPALGNSPLTSCAITNQGGATTPLSGNLGPFQYYSISKTTGAVDGKQLVLGPGVSFSANGTCPGTIIGGGSSNMAGSSFPAYVFYGGVDASAGATMGPGQYVFAGTTSTSGTVFTATSSGNGNSITGDGSTGTMFIFTDANYPGLVQAPAIGTSGMTFYQGDVYTKNTSLTLTGISESLPTAASSLDAFGNILFWQDQRNTSLKASGYYDSNGNWVTSATGPPSSYHVTATSPKIIMDHGNDNSVMAGVLYQPRGAWLDLESGGSSVSNSPLQVITGALTFGNGGGSANVVLLGASKPTIIYRTALIQ